MAPSRNEQLLDFLSVVKSVSRRRVRGIVSSSPQFISEITCGSRSGAVLDVWSAREALVESSSDRGDAPSCTPRNSGQKLVWSDERFRDVLDGVLERNADKRDRRAGKPVIEAGVCINEKGDRLVA